MSNRMKVVGKRLIVGILLLGLCGCGGQQAAYRPADSGDFGELASGTAIDGDVISGEAVSGEAASGTAVSGDGVSLRISVGRREKLSVPNPENMGNGNVEIRLQKVITDEDDKWGEPFDSFGDRYCTDLSFAGFDRDVAVTSFAVGRFSEDDSAASVITDTDTGETEASLGSCLALHIAYISDQELFEDDGYSVNSDGIRYFFVFLDYDNGRCYKVETECMYTDTGNWTKMTFADLTGDGIDELFVKAWHNKWASAEAYRYDEERDEVSRIFSSDEMGFEEAEEDFLWKPLDDYKIQIMLPSVGFSETISILNHGYSADQLEVGKGNEAEGYDESSIRLWENGKVKEYEKDSVFLYSVEKTALRKAEGRRKEVFFVRGLCIGHRSQYLGYVYVYTSFNPKTGRLEMSGAEFKKEFRRD